MRDLYAVIPTRGDRPHTLVPLLQQLRREDVETVIIWTRSLTPDTTVTLSGARWTVDIGARNIQRWWNLGLQTVDRLAARHGRPYAVAVLNDDVRLPDKCVATLAEALDTAGATVAFPDRAGRLPAGELVVNRDPDGRIDRRHRMTGYCYVLAGEDKMRLDEGFVWWFGDDDLERRAVAARGAVMVGGLKVANLEANGYLDAANRTQINRDRARFLTKWGRT